MTNDKELLELAAKALLRIRALPVHKDAMKLAHKYAEEAIPKATGGGSSAAFREANAPAPSKTSEDMESVLIDGVSYKIPLAIAAELFDLNTKLLRTRLALEAQMAVAMPKFDIWSANPADSWSDHPASAKIIEQCFAGDPKVGDTYTVTACWSCVDATYRITKIGESGDCEVECISHPNEKSVHPAGKDSEAPEERACS